MRGVFDPKALFEPKRSVPFPTLYREMDAELDAVQARKKSISCNNFLRGDIRDRRLRLAEFIDASIERGLTVVLRPASNRVSTDAFALYVEEVWRIPAITVMWETALVDGGWTNAAEILMSKLYGYSPQQSKAWLAYPCSRRCRLAPLQHDLRPSRGTTDPRTSHRLRRVDRA